MHSLVRKTFNDRELAEKYASKRSSVLRRAYLYAAKYQKGRIAYYLSDLGGQRNFHFLMEQFRQEVVQHDKAELHIALINICEKGYAQPNKSELQYLKDSFEEFKDIRLYDGVVSGAGNISSATFRDNKADLIARHEQARKSIEGLWSN